MRIPLLIIFMSLSFGLLANVTSSTLQKAIVDRLDLVKEFSKLKELANEMGIKEVYLFGGTASAWAHYVYADLQREDKNETYLSSRFDYDYTSIFRTNQDVDIVINGKEEDAAKLEKVMIEKFPFFQGKKSVFEVRLFHAARGDKDPLTSLDFLQQNTDSHSTGLIQLVGDGEKIRDLKDPNSKTPKFLKDVLQKKLTFYYDHAKHIKTKRFREGKNPEIVAVIRYLTKAFQYELEIDLESKKQIKEIVNDFNPKEIAKLDSYIAGWLERNGTKLFQNAANLEYAWNTLENLGLRKKLMEINSNVGEKSSLAWWMNKEPLRSKPLGEGAGKTAKQLSLSEVSHETLTFEAYESITKSYSGAPNAFVSRESQSGLFAGETAVHGSGFYTRVGHKGAKGSGITLHFQLNPSAREGSDFIVVGDIVLIKNRNALLLIPESIRFSILEYFKKLVSGASYFDGTNLAVTEQIKRRFENSLSFITESDRSKILLILKKYEHLKLIDKVLPDFAKVMSLDDESYDYLFSEVKRYRYKSLTTVLDNIFSRKEFQESNHFEIYEKVVTRLLDHHLLSNEDLRVALSSKMVNVLQPIKGNKEVREFILKKAENPVNIPTLLLVCGSSLQNEEELLIDLLKKGVGQKEYRALSMYLFAQVVLRGKHDFKKEELQIIFQLFEENVTEFRASGAALFAFSTLGELIKKNGKDLLPSNFDFFLKDDLFKNELLPLLANELREDSRLPYWMGLILSNNPTFYENHYKALNAIWLSPVMVNKNDLLLTYLGQHQRFFNIHQIEGVMNILEDKRWLPSKDVIRKFQEVMSLIDDGHMPTLRIYKTRLEHLLAKPKPPSLPSCNIEMERFMHFSS